MSKKIWTSKFVDVQSLFLDVQKFFGRPKLFRTSKTFWTSKHFWTSKKVLDVKKNLGRPKTCWTSKTFLDVQKFLDVQNFLDVQIFFWTSNFFVGRPNNFFGHLFSLQGWLPHPLQNSERRKITEDNETKRTKRNEGRVKTHTKVPLIVRFVSLPL